MKFTNDFTEIRVAAEEQSIPSVNEHGYTEYLLPSTGKRHRLDGPALEKNGYREWYVKGKRHRLNGHAVETPGGKQMYYWVNGKSKSKNSYPEAVRQYLVKSLHLPDMPFFALQDYLDELYDSDPNFLFEGKSYHDLADMIRQHYQNS